jgi:hypothetical protein
MKKKIIVMIEIIWICLCLMFVFSTFKHDIKKAFNNIFKTIRNYQP